MIGLLILTIDEPYFIKNIIKMTKNNNVKIYIHAKNIRTFREKLKKHIIQNIVETSWGNISLVKATINLLKASYEECDYFYLISGDTYIIKEPIEYEMSIFNYKKRL